SRSVHRGHASVLPSPAGTGVVAIHSHSRHHAGPKPRSPHRMATYGLPAWPWSGALVDDLPAPERLLADAFRLWSHEVARGAPSLPALRVLLAAEGAEAAAGPIEALLRTLARTGHPPVLACRLCP